MSSLDGDRGLDMIRLTALGRIPRCRDCSRHKTLSNRVETGISSQAPLPAIPAKCTQLHCAPIAVKYGTHEERSFDKALAS
jgi:hypothetical protein